MQDARAISSSRMERLSMQLAMIAIAIPEKGMDS